MCEKKLLRERRSPSTRIILVPGFFFWTIDERSRCGVLYFLEDVFRVEYLPVRSPIAVVWTAHRLSSTGEPDLNFREQGNSCTNTKLVHIYMKLEM